MKNKQNRKLIIGATAILLSAVLGFNGLSFALKREKKETIGKNISSSNFIDGEYGSIESKLSLDSAEKEVLQKQDFVFIKVENNTISEKEIEKAIEEGKEIGLIVRPTEYTYAAIYETIDKVKEIVAKYEINCPILYDISAYMEPDTIEANCKLAEEFCNKLSANNCYVGLYGNLKDMDSFTEAFGKIIESHSVEVYDKMIVLNQGLTEQIDKKVLDKGNMFCFKNGAILWKHDLAQIIEDNGLNEEENFTDEFIYTVEEGDSLYYIADLYDISLTNLKRYNHLISDTIQPGDEIKIPNNYTKKSGVEVPSNNKEITFEEREQNRDSGQLNRIVAGIDVSAWQGEIDWNKVKDETDYAIIRIGDFINIDENGNLIIDSQFYRNMEECKKYNIAVGVYYYSRATTKEEATIEAQQVVELLKGYALEYPLYIDIETNYQKEIMFYHPDEFEDMFSPAIDIINNAGFYPGIYGSKNDAANIMHMSDKCSFWLTSHDTYDNENSVTDLKETDTPIVYFPNEQIDSFQYSQYGSVAGINGYADIDYATKELEEKVEKKTKGNGYSR